MTSVQFQDLDYALVIGGDTHRMLVTCGLHGAIADDDGSRFWYSGHILALAGDGFMFLVGTGNEIRREGILRGVGEDPELEAALYAVWTLNADAPANTQLAWLFKYLLDALPELFVMEGR